MIDLNLAEPEERNCVHCFRPCGTRDGVLVHWPNESYAGKTTFKSWPDGDEMEPVSLWLYICRYCRAVRTRRENRANHLKIQR